MHLCNLCEAREAAGLGCQAPGAPRVESNNNYSNKALIS